MSNLPDQKTIDAWYSMESSSETAQRLAEEHSEPVEDDSEPEEDMMKVWADREYENQLSQIEERGIYD